MKVEEADPDRYGGALATTAAVTVGASLFGLGEQQGVFVCASTCFPTGELKIFASVHLRPGYISCCSSGLPYTC